MDDEIKKKAIEQLIAQSNNNLNPKYAYPDTGRSTDIPTDRLDSYVGAPIRAGLAKALDTNAQDGGGFLRPAVQGLAAGVNQFGNDPKTAPTGKDVAEKAGISSLPLSQTPVISNLYRQKNESPEAFDIRPEAGGMLDTSPAGMAGTGIEAAADPMSYMPMGKIKNLGAAVEDIAKQKALAQGGELNYNQLRKQMIQKNSPNALGQEATLNYPNMKNEYLAKNKPQFGEHNQPQFSEGLDLPEDDVLPQFQNLKGMFKKGK